MDEAEILRTLEGLELAETIVKYARETIEPRQKASLGGKQALEALREVAVPLDGRITTVRTLGEGGMGIVHLATQATLGRHVAVKTLRHGVADLDATLRILREAWVTGALEHPNIVPVYDVGVDADGAPIIVMKRVEGRAWSELLGAHDELTALLGVKDPLEANLRVFLAVCNAVSFAHDRGILHRDIKPENVMIGAFGEVYVLDWGIAVSLRDDPSGRLPPLAQATEIAGTPSYMAPEMLRGDPLMLSELTDVYLLGAVLYEVFQGEPPHVAPTTEAMVSRIILSQPPFAPSFPAEARRICARALAADPLDRFESVADLRKAVDDYLSHRGSRKLAWEAKQSLDALLHTIENDPPSEERSLAIFNLLGECRFGYRASLSAWAENLIARRGLDRALLAVVEHELAEGDPAGAATLLHEVSAAPPDLAARVERACRLRADEDVRLRRLDQDHDPTIGTRTRAFIGAMFGFFWTVTPLAAWLMQMRGYRVTHPEIALSSAFFLAIGVGLYVWARETLSKTQLNRQLARTFGIHLTVQVMLATGASFADLTPTQSLVIHVATWTLIQLFLAVWVARLFALSAAVSAVGFVLACRFSSLVFPIMAVCNAVLTLVLVRVWFPRDDVQMFAERGKAFHRRARRLFLEPDSRRRPIGSHPEELP
ncbi:MAG TPA: serine/threonine-protein kinase [Byssovorax sp.]|jgi:serine/threonine-protein kinase